MQEVDAVTHLATVPPARKAYDALLACTAQPKFTTVRDGEDKLEYGGELKAMGFQSKLLQHDPSLRAVLLAPWTFTRVENAGSKGCI